MGSEVACRTLVDQVTQFVQLGGGIANVTRETALEWLEVIRAKLATQADALGIGTRELACTLVAALVGRDSAAFLQIGDGAIVVVTGDNDYRVIFWPEQGEYANTTYFVTSPDAAARFHVEAGPVIVSDIAVFSDGLQNIALRHESKTPYAPFFAPMFSRLRADDHWVALNEQLRAFLASEAVTKRTDDDCTLMLASRL